MQHQPAEGKWCEYVRPPLPAVYLKLSGPYNRAPLNLGAAAVIAARARATLYRGFRGVIESGGRLLFCDTDSIVAAFPAGWRLWGQDLGGVVFNPDSGDVRISESLFISKQTYFVRFEGGLASARVGGVSVSLSSLEDFRSFVGLGGAFSRVSKTSRLWSANQVETYPQLRS